jgi:allantoicase
MLRQAIDLASQTLRGYVLAASDELLGPRARLLEPAEPRPRDGQVDGWQTRRRRDEGPDWAIVRLGVPGLLEELVVDTTGFPDSSPTHVSVEGCVASHGATWQELEGWQEILPRSPLQEGSRSRFPVSSQQRFSHLRLSIFPDGGVARFRALGRALPTWMAPGRLPPAPLDLARAGNGARIDSCSDGSAESCRWLLASGPAAAAEQVWRTRRRRQPGSEWVVLKLAGPARVQAVTLDTAHLEGDCPALAALQAATSRQEPGHDDWFELLPPQRMVPCTEHHFQDELKDNAEVRWVRLSLLPDGGMARCRLWGELTADGLRDARLSYLNASAEAELRPIFTAVCHSARWVAEMCRSGPFESVQDLQKKGASAWSRCREADWREALKGHPRIGERQAGRDLASHWSRGEQSKAAQPDEAVKAELRDKQLAYEEHFGFLFLICATGRSSSEILHILNERLRQTPERELQTVAEELAKIIHLRLEKLLQS